ncbi:hypothetical protein C8Q74DRAFT_1371522 [Fomes fomentarius]|nr:hypothetical protein C8Q74DRAFT_1371522 [Fomes fomentarius]
MLFMLGLSSSHIQHTRIVGGSPSRFRKPGKTSIRDADPPAAQNAGCLHTGGTANDKGDHVEAGAHLGGKGRDSEVTESDSAPHPLDPVVDEPTTIIADSMEETLIAQPQTPRVDGPCGTVDDILAKSRQIEGDSAVSAAHNPSTITNWELYRDAKEIRGGKGQTVWYKTFGPYTLFHPPASLQATVDEMYIHHDQRTSRVAIWVVDGDGGWITARSGTNQPFDPARRLSIQRNGDPSWVTKETWSAYRSRRKQRTAVLLVSIGQ